MNFASEHSTTEQSGSLPITTLPETIPHPSVPAIGYHSHDSIKVVRCHLHTLQSPPRFESRLITTKWIHDLILASNLNGPEYALLDGTYPAPHRVAIITIPMSSSRAETHFLYIHHDRDTSPDAMQVVTVRNISYATDYLKSTRSSLLRAMHVIDQGNSRYSPLPANQTSTAPPQHEEHTLVPPPTVPTTSVDLTVLVPLQSPDDLFVSNSIFAAIADASQTRGIFETSATALDLKDIFVRETRSMLTALTEYLSPPSRPFTQRTLTKFILSVHRHEQLAQFAQNAHHPCYYPGSCPLNQLTAVTPTSEMARQDARAYLLRLSHDYYIEHLLKPQRIVEAIDFLQSINNSDLAKTFLCAITVPTEVPTSSWTSPDAS